MTCGEESRVDRLFSFSGLLCDIKAFLRGRLDTLLCRTVVSWAASCLSSRCVTVGALLCLDAVEPDASNLFKFHDIFAAWQKEDPSFGPFILPYAWTIISFFWASGFSVEFSFHTCQPESNNETESCRITARRGTCSWHGFG